jgi:hypothetical protein
MGTGMGTGMGIGVGVGPEPEQEQEPESEVEQPNWQRLFPSLLYVRQQNYADDSGSGSPVPVLLLIIAAVLLRSRSYSRSYSRPYSGFCSGSSSGCGLTIEGDCRTTRLETTSAGYDIVMLGDRITTESKGPGRTQLN